MSITLDAKVRTIKGKKVKVLRREGLVPAEIYGNGDNASVQIVEKELIGAMRQAGTTKLIAVDVEGTKYDVLVKEVVRSLDRKSVVHIDLFSVDKNAAVKAIVPITLIGESPLIFTGGIAVSGASEVEVLCLPDKIPACIEVDTTPITEFSQILTIADLVVEDGLEVTSNPSTMVAYISQTRATREAAALDKADEAAEGEQAES